MRRRWAAIPPWPTQSRLATDDDMEPSLIHGKSTDMAWFGGAIGGLITILPM